METQDYRDYIMETILWKPNIYYCDYIMETLFWRPNIMETIL